MKAIILSMLILVQFGIRSELVNNLNDFECTITSTRNVYKIGETPKIKVSIINKSNRDVYLIGSLDASEEKWRNPYCYFTIEKPMKDSMSVIGRCGNMNSLRKEDFKLIKSGESFDPYESGDAYGFFDSFQISRKENFRNPGKYIITFHYSTESTNIEDYLGDGTKNRELEKLFDKVSNIELSSNSIEIEMKFTDKSK